MAEFLLIFLFTVALTCCISNAIELFINKRYFWGSAYSSMGLVILLAIISGML